MKCKLLPFLNTSVAVASDRMAPKGLPHTQDRRQEAFCTCCARLQLADSEATCHGAERHTIPGDGLGGARRVFRRWEVCPPFLCWQQWNISFLLSVPPSTPITQVSAARSPVLGIRDGGLLHANNQTISYWKVYLFKSYLFKKLSRTVAQIWSVLKARYCRYHRTLSSSNLRKTPEQITLGLLSLHTQPRNFYCDTFDICDGELFAIHTERDSKVIMQVQKWWASTLFGKF